MTSAPLHDEAGALIGSVAVSEDHTERLRAQREAEALAAVSVALASSLDPATLYRVILEQATSVLPCGYASVLLYEEGWVTVAAAWGTPERPPGTRLFPLTGPGRLWLPTTPGRPTIVPDTDLEPAWRDIAPLVDQQRMRSAMGMPITIDGEQVGAFTLNSRQPRFYTAQQARLIALFAERFSLALRNARRFADEQKRAHAAEALAQLRADFVAAVSHELRTPLTAIVGFGELLEAHWEQMSEATRRERIGRIVQAANRLHRQVEDLLLISRVETERLVPVSMPLDLAPLLAQAVAEVQAHYRGQAIVLEGPPEVRVRADPTRTIQVLVNLLDNAAKYSPEGSPIAVTWQRAGAMIVVRVADQGPGVPEQGRDQLFTRFGRFPGSRIRAGRVGTGLGLYLSRRLAEAMGGDLDLEATGPEGSTFRLRLPIVS
jgi:signal transduction histidine kinase